jgi:hypothetical protein
MSKRNTKKIKKSGRSTRAKMSLITLAAKMRDAMKRLRVKAREDRKIARHEAKEWKAKYKALVKSTRRMISLLIRRNAFDVRSSN